MQQLSRHQESVQIAAKTNMSPRTVRRWLDGERVSPAVAFACEQVAAKMGIEPRPPKGDEATGTEG
jgi:hypothetical protein